MAGNRRVGVVDDKAFGRNDFSPGASMLATVGWNQHTQWNVYQYVALLIEAWAESYQAGTYPAEYEEMYRWAYLTRV